MHKRFRDTAEAKRIQALKIMFKKVVRLDRALIRTPHVIRTIPERMKLCTLLAKLMCLSQFTPKMRARLVPLIRIMSVDAGRIIIRQSDIPITVFFVLTGEVHMLKEDDEQEEFKAVLGPGDMMGYVELLEGFDRKHTFRAATYCELLVLFDYDFFAILGPFMTKIWDEKKRALKALDYFDFLDDDQIIEACRFGKLKQFEPLQTIFCEDIGSTTNVHFVLSGECLILQCLNIKTSVKKGKKDFQLMPAGEGNVSMMFKQGVRSTYVNPNPKTQNDSKIDIAELVQSSSSSSSSSSKENNPSRTLNRTMRKMKLRDIENICDLIKPVPVQKTHFTFRRTTVKSKISIFSEDDDKFIEEDVYEDFWEMCEDLNGIEINSSDSDILSIAVIKPFRPNSIGSENYEIDQHDFDSLSSFSSSSDEATNPVVESHFIDVGSLTFGGIFGLGEKMEHRVVMARTTVQCLILPRFFLLEKKQNPGNIWERRLLYIDCMIPSREALFEHYLKACEWKKFKNDFIRESLKPSDNDSTHVNDIPIICRIAESSEDAD
ncbi:uncharacterized protein LOC108096282 isoform X2 [Drosophila ficusphila]|uniref:uncharacterized protein LOC108096282 isoform X2 n=1 Tax=Drosophila ficusphila TaxID=30025 RepID=UPI0007E5C5D4|nr:uncharacterized protein LOC108096282 isoform X2 [Drosophila ficusphila]